MRKANIHIQGKFAGCLEEDGEGNYSFTYQENYDGGPVSLTMPPRKHQYKFKTFPPFFEGLLPEGNQLEALLRTEKIDRKDFFSQLVTVGADLVGDVTVKRAE